MPLIGTAGHVDHGKSTLIEALTGRDPDRWEEEKRRGLTIDLGFAWTILDEGREVSFVDVPGHERYLKNMLAGIEVIDVALLVVAADEGWMPQSEEHLAVLDLLDIDRGVVALTKVDLVDNDVVELAALEVSERLAGTTLEGAEIVPVSARTGEGVDLVRERLSTLVTGVSADGDRPRLWVDRSFSVPGAGTVVTGTLIEGPIAVGDTVEILPGHMTARVRGLQSHESEIASALPGRRLALNLGGVARDEVKRGSMLGLPGQWRLTDRLTARIRVARYVDELPQRGSFHLHFGSGAYPVDIKRVEGEHALLQVAEPIPMRSGDRFVLRETGRKLVVGGGVVVDPAPGRAKRSMGEVARIDPLAGRDQVAESLLEVRGVDDLDRIVAHSGGGHPLTGIIAGATVITQARFEQLRIEAGRAVLAHHAEHPLRAGLPLATLAARLEIPKDLADRLVHESPTLGRSGPIVTSIEHQQELDEEMEAQWVTAGALLRAGLGVPNVTDLGLGRELVHLLVRLGKLIRVSDDLCYLPEQIDQLVSILKEMEHGFTVADFRDRTGLSRKYAVPLLEWSDREGLTIRQGDQRHLR